MTTAAQNLDPGVYVTNDVGLEVTDGIRSRVQIGHLVATGDFGIRVVSSDGTTVIIDGTSDMFRISVTGTLATTWPTITNSTNFADIALTGLGTFGSVPPAVMWETIPTASSAGAIRRAGTYLISFQASGIADSYLECTSTIDGSSHLVVELDANTNTGAYGAGIDVGARYWVLAQTSI
jgi:hypothetical protein